MIGFYIFNLILALVVVAGFATVAYLLAQIRAIPLGRGSEKAVKIAELIRRGSLIFLTEEYRVIVVVLAVIFGLLVYTGHVASGFSFLLGAFSSLTCGFIGLYAATEANLKTAVSARSTGEAAAFTAAFLGGGVMGFTVASMGILTVGLLLFLLYSSSKFILLFSTFGLGASLVAFFARVGGGIYTKSADIGADLAGKLEANIPEDDIRNPAVIADNVGDNVGDTAGMGADIYESYVGSMIASMILSLTAFPGSFLHISLPLVLSTIGLFSSMTGLFLNRLVALHPAATLRYGTNLAIVLFVLLSKIYLKIAGIELFLFWSIVIGAGAGITIGLITEYYTGCSPVDRLAKISRSGAAPNIIYGLSIGMESIILPVVCLLIGIWFSYTYGGGLFGVSIASVAMLATVGITMTVDAYGPIADNAGGIAEMAGFDKAVRTITDTLDSLGNTTAAIGKGFATGSALLSALGLFVAYTQQAHIAVLDITDIRVLIGIFVGALVPFLVSAMTMRSVGSAAQKMVLEVRRQFTECADIMTGRVEPDYDRCIAISSRAALYEMILPAVVTIITPVLIFFSPLGRYGLGGLLLGATVTGVMLALMMANSGGAWDNAKKYIEAGKLEDEHKGTPAHRAAIVGDTLGDPFKDTSGPSLNILIKLMAIISLLLVTIY